MNLVLKSRPEGTFWLVASFLDDTSDTGDSFDAGSFKLGHLQGRVEHSLDESSLFVDLERASSQFQFLRHICRLVAVNYGAGRNNSKPSLKICKKDLGDRNSSRLTGLG